MKHARIWLTTGFALLIATTAAAHPRDAGDSVENGGHFGEQRMERHLDRMVEALELDDGQKAQVEVILTESRDRHAARREGAQAKQEMLQSLLDSNSPDPAEVGALMIEIHQSRQQMSAEREQVHAEISALLTPDQLQRLDAVKEMRSEENE